MINDYVQSSLISLSSMNEGVFPSTRYQGSKAKLISWIWGQISDLNFDTCMDAFGGTGSVAYKLKQKNKEVTYNDILKFNYYIGKAIIENNNTLLNDDDIAWLLSRHDFIKYDDFIQRTFVDIYFTKEENYWLDQTVQNISAFENEFKQAIAYFALFQSCIIKRPYNLFHRKNLYIRFANVNRSFGNKSSWDRPFDEWFTQFANEANNAVFTNNRNNRALNNDVMTLSNQYDLVYIDTPYISNKGIGLDYYSFYHFLEGLTLYSTWNKDVDYKSKHRRLNTIYSPWNDKKMIKNSFDQLIEKFKNSIIVISYRSDGIPSESELLEIVSKYKKEVTISYYGKYKYVLSTNGESKEILIIGK